MSFDRGRLPNPETYLRSVGVELKGRGIWKSGLCPFHDDQVASLRVHSVDGAFKCQACGAKGHDLIAFERLRTGAGFVEAAKALGAWND